jgi:hypothetical protein
MPLYVNISYNYQSAAAVALPHLMITLNAMDQSEVKLINNYETGNIPMHYIFNKNMRK